MYKVWARISGGLGNQLYQYAAGRALASRLGATLELDTSAYLLASSVSAQGTLEVKRLGIMRHYELEHFGVQAPILRTIPPTLYRCLYLLAYKNEESPLILRKIRYRLFNNTYKLQRLVFYRQLRRANFTCINEPYHDMSAWEQLKGNIYLEGHWQSEGYFSNIAADLRKELSLSRFAGPKTASLLAEIAQPGSVSVHFRRGDYHRQGSILPIAYYAKALELLSTLIQKKSLRLYIFSDDLDDDLRSSLPGLLQSQHYSIVSDKTYSAHEEMLLISRCEHHIMANSSYSWWAAWLHDIDKDPRPGEKYVLTPHAWFSSKTVQVELNCCKGWILVK